MDRWTMIGDLIAESRSSPIRSRIVRPGLTAVPKRGEKDKCICICTEGIDDAFMFGYGEELGSEVPTQAQSVVEGSGTVLVSEYKPTPDLDYLQVKNLIEKPRTIICH